MPLRSASLIGRAGTLVRAIRAVRSDGSINWPLIRYLAVVTIHSLRDDGVGRTFSRIGAAVGRGAMRSLLVRPTDAAALLASGENGAISAYYPGPCSHGAPNILSPRALLIAETSIPQCRKYRVDQKAEMLALLGVEATIIDWRQTAQCRDALQTHSFAIFYRVPAFPHTLGLIEEARRLKVPSIWEVDDLIFDTEGYVSNRNLKFLPPGDRRGVLAGVPLYRDALRACDEALASTPMLAKAMREASGHECHVVENGLDRETLAIARRIRRTRRAAFAAMQTNPTTVIRIGYGSGSKTHDADFLAASAGVLQIMRARRDVVLRIVGDLALPPEFGQLADRIERYPAMAFVDYLRLLGECDISIAPLENNTFNDAKSNIKFLEASALALPSVCSPTASFRQVVKDGANGLLASDAAEWHDKLLRLVDDPRLRNDIGAQACVDVLRRYRSGSLAHRQLAPLVARHAKASRSRKHRIAFVNCYYHPRRFGGATIVVEEMVKRLAKRGDTEVFVFTTWSHEGAEAYSAVRYEADGGHIFAVRLPAFDDRMLDVENPKMGEAFRRFLDAARPDVVHMHAIQGLSVSIAEPCIELGIPYVITLHDAWWLCERQFMVRADNRYCFQERIDPAVCARCVADESFTTYRRHRLRWVLDQAARLLSPSAFFRRLYLANQIPAHKLVVNRNGVRPPRAGYTRTTSDVLRFGYVGGATPIKGFHLIKQAFEKIEESSYELVIVDNTLNLGHGSIAVQDWRLKGELTVAPAYTQETMDEFFARIDVLLFPTQWKESFGLTVREALIRDIWVIATDAGGVAEDIVDGVNGTIVPMVDDAGPLRQAILQALAIREALATFVNPHKNDIQSFDRQAAELHACLIDVASGTAGPAAAETALRIVKAEVGEPILGST